MTNDKVENKGDPNLQRDSGNLTRAETLQGLPYPAKAYDDRSDSLADREVDCDKSEEEARASTKIGEIVAEKYKILGLLGLGGMSAVYRAEHLLTNKIIALKLMHGKLLNDANSMRRFQQEARAASRLTHPHAITVHDMGLTDAQPYLVMDCLEGKALSTVIRQEGKISVERAIKIFIQACSALAEAHKLGIVHRDLKPSNIMLVEEQGETDFVKIVDFGIAKILSQGGEAQKLTTTGEVFGSPMYMSPEQCAARPMDSRSDIYSMGCLMYESLCGQPPFEGENVITTLFKQLNEAPPSLKGLRGDPTVIAGLNRIVQKTLAKDPGQRYQTVGELSDELINVQKLVGQRISPFTRLWLKLSSVRFVPVLPSGPGTRSTLIGVSVALVCLTLVGVLLSPDYGVWKDPPASQRLVIPVPITYASWHSANPSSHANHTPKGFSFAQVALSNENVEDFQEIANTVERLAQKARASGDLMLAANFCSDALDNLTKAGLRHSWQAADLLINKSECNLYLKRYANLRNSAQGTDPEEVLEILSSLENQEGAKALRAQACFGEYLLGLYLADKGESTAPAVCSQFLTVAYMWSQMDTTKDLFGEESPAEMTYHLAVCATELANFYPEFKLDEGISKTRGGDGYAARRVLNDAIIELQALRERLINPNQIAAATYDIGALYQARAYEDKIGGDLAAASKDLSEAEKCFMQTTNVNDASAALVLFDLADLQWKRHSWWDAIQTRAQARRLFNHSRDRVLS